MEYKTKEDVFNQAQIILHKTLRDIIPKGEIARLESEIVGYGKKRKGHLGELVEWYVFGKKPDSRSEADFNIAGVELKTNPLKKHSTKNYVSKERLVFSMIDYDKIVNEKWGTSTFLQKNSLLLLMFYLYAKEENLLDYNFKFIQLLDLLNDISAQDVEQIKKDWEFIVEKIKRGEAHLLSEGDTYYLGACTKAKNSSVVRDQPRSRIPAKPRAFSLKQTYLNYLIQSRLLGKSTDADSIYEGVVTTKTIDEVIADRFKRFIGKTDKEIMSTLGWTTKTKSKNFKRLLANRIMTSKGSNKIEELEKANVEMRVMTLEHTGTLRESLSFPAFDYNELVTQVWYDEAGERMSDFHAKLEMKKFFFVVFRKIKGGDEIVLEKVMFWNFPMSDIDKAKNVWDETIRLINEGKIVKKVTTQKSGKLKRFTYFPGSNYNGVAHVRPHGDDAQDEAPLPVADLLTKKKEYTKHCFWLNAKYIQKAIEGGRS